MLLTTNFIPKPHVFVLVDREALVRVPCTLWSHLAVVGIGSAQRAASRLLISNALDLVGIGRDTLAQTA